LSNHHVLTHKGAGKGDEIGQPGRCCCCCFKDVVGHILDIKFGDQVDCGIAKIKSDVAVTLTAIRALGGKDGAGNELDGHYTGRAPLKTVSGKQTSLEVNDLVRKVGISTGLTEGKVKDIFLDIVDGTSGDTLHEQIDILPGTGFDKFGDEGDSGAVILNASNQVAGLFWAGDEALGIGTANDIQFVASAMKINFNVPSPPPNPIALTPSFVAGGAPLIFPATEPEFVEVATADRKLLERFERAFLQTAKGSALMDVVRENQEEVLDLVNHNRQVMVTWRRKQGPAFLAAFAKSGGDPSYKIRKEVNGVTLQTLLQNMAVVLEEHGSGRLRQALRGHALEVFNYAHECDSLEALLERLRRAS
jgi:hypothetical protein